MCASLRSHLSPFVSLSRDIWDVWKIACVSCTDYDGMDLCGENGSKNNFSKVKGKFWGCKMITATGNRMLLLQTASHDTVCECAASFTFSPPLALSHAMNFTPLSPIPKSSSFHAKAWLVTSFFCACGISPLRRSSSSYSTVYKPQFHQCHYKIPEIFALLKKIRNYIWA